MLSRKWSRSKTAVFALFVIVTMAALSIRSGAAQPREETAPAQSFPGAARWQTPARQLRGVLRTRVRGTLAIDSKGVRFQAGNRREQSWVFEEIRTAFIAPHRLELETYENRSWRLPGAQHFTFNLTRAMPPAIAAVLAARIARPVQNADPDPNAPALATIPVRHRELTRGTNGLLRFRRGGIDYVTSSKDDSRSWRWADLQTLSDPDPYHLFIFGYRDTYTFDLKAPLTRTLFNRATDEIYAHNESISVYAPGTTLQPNSHGAEMREK